MPEKKAVFNNSQRKTGRRNPKTASIKALVELPLSKVELHLEKHMSDDPSRSEVIYRLIEVIKSL